MSQYMINNVASDLEAFSVILLTQDRYHLPLLIAALNSEVFNTTCTFSMLKKITKQNNNVCQRNQQV